MMLFSNFLEDRRIYNLVEAYWRRLFHQLFGPAGIPFREFYNKHFADGQKIYDGNPIFDAYFPSRHKLARVIQFLPEEGDLMLTGWVDEFPAQELDAAQQPSPADAALKGTPVPELVLSLALTRETMAQARELLQKWISENSSPEEMEQHLAGLSAAAAGKPPAP